MTARLHGAGAIQPQANRPAGGLLCGVPWGHNDWVQGHQNVRFHHGKAGRPQPEVDGQVAPFERGPTAVASEPQSREVRERSGVCQGLQNGIGQGLQVRMVRHLVSGNPGQLPWFPDPNSRRRGRTVVIQFVTITEAMRTPVTVRGSHSWIRRCVGGGSQLQCKPPHTAWDCNGRGKGHGQCVQAVIV